MRGHAHENHRPLPARTPNHIPADPEQRAACHRELEERAAEYRRQWERSITAAVPGNLEVNTCGARVFKFQTQADARPVVSRDRRRMPAGPLAGSARRPARLACGSVGAPVLGRRTATSIRRTGKTDAPEDSAVPRQSPAGGVMLMIPLLDEAEFVTLLLEVVGWRSRSAHAGETAVVGPWRCRGAHADLEVRWDSVQPADSVKRSYVDPTEA